jgi:lysophospholipase L1-like esterase
MKLLLKGLIFSLLALYAALFIYFYQQKGLRIVGWHTHVLFPVYVGAIIYLLIRYIAEPLSGKRLNKVLLKWMFLVWLLFVSEMFLMFFNRQVTSADTGNGYYWAPYNSKGASYYHIWPPNEVHHLRNNEFHFTRNTNSLGFSDKEWTIKKDSATRRILCLGDSFTEGDGAAYDSSYPSVLQSILEKQENVEVMNAGVCGSDPFFNFKNLTDRLIAYQPDIIIQTITENDIYTDLMVRGGMERFHSDQQLRFNQPPAWEPLYALSYLIRLHMHHRGFSNILKHTVENEQQYLIQELSSLMAEYDRFCREHQIQLYWVYMPLKAENSDTRKSELLQIISSYCSELKQSKWVDLTPCYQKYFEREDGNYTSFYWQVDGHHNAKGYEMMAECIASSLRQRP